jgi:large subunit ribosomal protein L24
MPRTKNKQKKLHIKKGDVVALTKAITSSKNAQTGNTIQENTEDGKTRVIKSEKGDTGRVLAIYPDRDMVLVEGVNVRIRHQKPTQQLPQGGRIEREAPIHISNVMPVDSEGNPTRVGRKRVEDPETGRGHWVRYAKTTGEELD